LLTVSTLLLLLNINKEKEGYVNSEEHVDSLDSARLSFKFLEVFNNEFSQKQGAIAGLSKTAEEINSHNYHDYATIAARLNAINGKNNTFTEKATKRKTISKLLLPLKMPTKPSVLLSLKRLEITTDTFVTLLNLLVTITLDSLLMMLLHIKLNSMVLNSSAALTALWGQLINEEKEYEY
jgi:hypothetical protein